MKKFLLASDGSKYAEEAAWFLAHLPHNDKIELVVLTVIQPPYANHTQQVSNWTADHLGREKRLADESFQKVVSMFDGANAMLRHETREGNRGETIVQVAKDEQVDIVLVGARGHSAVSRLLLGSTSDFVATHAPCSVLVVRPTGLRQQERPIRIVIGYDDSLASQAAVEEFVEIPWGTEPDVDVVSVSIDSSFVDEKFKKTVASAAEKAAAQLEKVAPNAEAHTFEVPHVGDGLVNYAEQHESDLIVVGETPHTLLGRFLMGSVSRFVLRHAPCSVWITRNRMAKEL